MSIYAKLAKIQDELFVPKQNRNDFGKYNYRSCEDILKTVKPLCKSNGCVLYISNDLVEIGGRNYVKAECHLVDTESGEEVTSTAHAREDEVKKGMDGSQITGTSSSYARKYALAGLFSIDNEKDSDATYYGDDEEKEQISAVDEAKIRTEVLKKAQNSDKPKENIEAICKWYKVESLNDLTLEQCQQYLSIKKEK